MKIAFDHQAFSIQPYGGVSRYYVRLAEELLSMNEDVGIFSPFHQNRYLDPLPNGVVHGRHVNRYPKKTTGLITSLNHIIARRAIRKWRPQIVHETYYARKGSAPDGCATVITVYDMIHELFTHAMAGRDETTKKKRIAVERAGHVICISESTRNDLIDIFDVPENKVSVIHLGFERFERRKSNAHASDLTKRKFILYVGYRGGYKNFNNFIKAVAESTGLIADFDVIAFGGGEFSREEWSHIYSLGFREGQVKQMSGDDCILGELYDMASGFVYPSLYEGFGLSPLEAMAHNCPVISSNSSSMPEVIGQAAEFFNPNSIEEMTVAIENVLYSNDRADELRALGLEQLAKFSWQKCAEETLDVYQQVLER